MQPRNSKFFLSAMGNSTNSLYSLHLPGYLGLNDKPMPNRSRLDQYCQPWRRVDFHPIHASVGNGQEIINSGLQPTPCMEGNGGYQDQQSVKTLIFGIEKPCCGDPLYP